MRGSGHYQMDACDSRAKVLNMQAPAEFSGERQPAVVWHVTVVGQFGSQQYCLHRSLSLSLNPTLRTPP